MKIFFSTQQFSGRQGFTILELMLVFTIVAIVAGITGTAYFSAARNARIDREAQTVLTAIQEARSLGIDNKQLVSDANVQISYYEVLLNFSTPDVVNIQKSYFDSDPDGGGGPVPYETLSGRKGFTIENISSVPGAFAGQQVLLRYYLPHGDLVICNSACANQYTTISFDLKDNYTGRKIRFSTNTVNGLIETEFIP